MAKNTLLYANPLTLAAKTAGVAAKKAKEEERKKKAKQTTKAAKSPVSMAVKAAGETAQKATQAARKTSEKQQQEKSRLSTSKRTNYLDKGGQFQRPNPLTLAQANAATGVTGRDLVNIAKAGGVQPDKASWQRGRVSAYNQLQAREKALSSIPLSKQDKKLPKGSQDTIREATKAWREANAAGDEAGKAAAHAKAEQARSFAGYSGGNTGWEYHTPELSTDEKRKLTQQGQKALKKAKLDWEKANAAGDEAGKEAAAKRGQEVRAAKGYRAGGTPGLEYTDAHGRSIDVMTPAEREKWKEQTAAAWKATGTGLAGSVLSAAETAGQATRNRIQENRWESDLGLANNLDNIRARLRRAQAGESSEDVTTLQRLYDRALSAQERINRRWANPRSDIVDPNLPGQRLMEKSQEYTAQALQGKSGLEKLLTQAGVSIGQNLPSMGLAFVPGVGPALGAGLMGAQAAGSKSYELNQRGVSPGESLARGLVSGGIEAATEYLPIKSLLSIVKGKGGQNVLKSLASQSGIEATEEGAAYVGNYIADKAAQDPDANFDLRDLAENAAVGAISGAVFGGAGGAVNAAARARSNARQTNPLLRTIDRLSGAEVAQEAAQETGRIEPQPAAQPRQRDQTSSLRESLRAREEAYASNVMDFFNRYDRANEQERAAMEPEAEALRQEERSIARARTRIVQQEQAAQARQEAAAQSSQRQSEPVVAQAAVQASQPENHIDNRNVQSVSARSVNAFQFDNPQLHPYYAKAAQELINDAEHSLSTQRSERGRGTVATRSAALEQAEASGLSRQQIIKVCQDIIADNGQENYAAAKRVELVLDDMLSKGYVRGEDYGNPDMRIPANQEYITAKSQIPGAVTQDSFAQYLRDNALALELGEVTEEELRQEWGKSHPRTLNNIIRDSREAISENGVIISISEADFRMSDKKLKDKIADFFNEIGNKVTRPGFGDVEITKRGIKSSVAHGIGAKKAAAFRAVPSVIQNGVVIDEQSDWKGRGYDTVVFGGRIKIDGIDYDMGVVVKKYNSQSQNSKYYLREVLIAEESGTSPFSTRTREGYPSDEVPLNPSVSETNQEVNEVNQESPYSIGAAPAGFVPYTRAAFRQQQEAGSAEESSEVPALQADTSLFERDILRNLNQARKSFISYARDHFPRIVRNKETGKAIKISRNGIDKFLSGRIPYEKYATGFHIPELIQQAKKTGRAADNKGREFIHGYEYYETPIRVDGKDYTAYIRVRNTESGDSYYGHTIGEIDQIKIEPPARVEAESATEPVYARNGSMESSARADAQGASNPVNAIDDSINSIQRELAPVNSESSPYSIGAAPAGFDPYTRAANEYGTIEPGETPARIVDVPRSMTGEDRVRRWARTALEAEITSPETQEQIAQGIVENGFSYHPNKDRDSLERAYKTIEEKGVEGALNQWQDVVDGNRRAGKDDMVLAQALYVNAERSGDSSLAAQLAAQIAAEGTISGQNVQALRLLKQATPEGRVYYMRKIVGKLNEDLAKKKRVDKLAENESIQLDDGLLQAYLEAEGSQAQADALNAIYDDVASQMDPTAGDVLNAWRYFAMLGNPRTHIRNVLGNVIFGTVRNASNELSSVLQRGLIRDSAQRTRAVVSTPAARAFAQADYQEMKDALAGNKYNSDLDEIRRRVQNNALGPLSFLSKANSWALSAEDNLFKRLEYTRSLASYITAHGWDPANMTHSQLQAARTHAMNDALEATFQEASQVASAISRFEQTNALTRVAVGGAFPFKGVPINIAKEGFRYSPAGLMKAITADAAKVKRGEMTAADMIDNLSSGLTGTGIAMLGYWLSSLGLVTAGAGEDDKENLLDMANGSQNYSLNIGSWSYTIDWAAPAVLPLFIGAEFETMRKEQAGEEGEEGRADQRFGHGLQALGRMFEPMLDMTVLSGVSSTIQSATYSQGNPLTAVGGNLVQNFGGQVVPTLLGQIARTVDPVRRSTYTDKDSGIPTSIQRFIQTQQNKIPGLSQRNVPYLNVWGEETVNENLLIRTLQNFVSPGYIARRTNDGLSDELKRLNSLGYEGVLPSMRQKGQSIDLDQDGEKERLTREQWEAWQRSQGQTAKTLLNDLLSSQSYQNMTDNEKAAAVKRTLDYSKESGKLDAGGSEEGLDKWVLNAREYARDYGGGSPQGFFDAYNRRAELGKTDYDKGIQQGLVEDYINSTQQSQAAKNYLLDAIKVFQQIPANSGNYNKAKAQGYTDPEEISALLRGKKSADTNGNGNYTQKELSDYIKSQTTDPAEQERLWNVYKNSNWKKTWAQVSSGSNGKKKSSTKKSKGKGTFYLY